MVWYADVLTDVQSVIENVDWTPLLGERRPEITSRVKTIDTLRDRLRDQRSMKLPNIQDVAGLRFEAEMTLAEQDAVITAIRGCFDHDEAAVHDLREGDHSGYRAVHLWLRLDARVEVQVRTHLQSAWANAYEAAGDVLGRSIRYGAIPEAASSAEIVRSMQRISCVGIARVEDSAVEIQRLALTIHEAEQNLGHVPAHDTEKAAAQLSETRARLERMQQAQRGRENDLRSGLDELRDLLIDMHREARRDAH
ncbi:hypothetical protein [Herbiconiux sp.]|uniref:hypothetical protein n=1 Tax=Herbiconiux sp. TaxID=1871186 RepID=UPI0025B88425|nr:hypothetical protein [Herbiconiux sp.]